MTDFYLITGFLGAGKTTFLREFIRRFRDRRIRLIINEFGRVGVDGVLLNGEGASLTEICDGSIFCSCRIDRFEKALAEALADDPEVILTEASGLSDPGGIRAILENVPAIRDRGSICLADARRLSRLCEVVPVVRKQLAVSSLVLLSKTDLALPAESAEALRTIASASPAAQVHTVCFGRFDPAWLSELRPLPGSGTCREDRDLTLQKDCLIADETLTGPELLICLEFLCGSCYRIKGFVQLADGRFFADCTGPDVRLTPWTGAADNRIVLLAGKGMPLRKAVRTALEMFPGRLRKPEGP